MSRVRVSKPRPQSAKVPSRSSQRSQPNKCTVHAYCFLIAHAAQIADDSAATRRRRRELADHRVVAGWWPANLVDEWTGRRRLRRDRRKRRRSRASTISDHMILPRLYCACHYHCPGQVDFFGQGQAIKRAPRTHVQRVRSHRVNRVSPVAVAYMLRRVACVGAVGRYYQAGSAHAGQRE